MHISRETVFPEKAFYFQYLVIFSFSLFHVNYSFIFSSEDHFSYDTQLVTRSISYCSVLEPFKFPL